ncbi:expressed unknown protein (Partial), partial [Seminavis robusta]
SSASASALDSHVPARDDTGAEASTEDTSRADSSASASALDSSHVPARDDTGAEASTENTSRAESSARAWASEDEPLLTESEQDQAWADMESKQDRNRELERIGMGGDPSPCSEQRKQRLLELYENMHSKKWKDVPLPGFCYCYFTSPKLVWMVMPGSLAQVKWNAQTSMWKVRFHGEDGNIAEHSVSDRMMDQFLTDRGYRMLNESEVKKPGGWKNIPPKYQQLYVETLTYTESRPRADGGVEMKDPVANVCVSYDAQDDFCFNARWKEAGEAGKMFAKEQKNEFNSRRDAKDTVFRRMRIGCAGPSEDSKFDYFEGPTGDKVELTFKQAPGTLTCISSAMSSAAKFMGYKVKAHELNNRLNEELRKSKQACGDQYVKSLDEYVNKCEGIICQTLVRKPVDALKSFNPLTYDGDDPVLVKLKIKDSEHVVVFCKGLLFEPSLPYALAASQKNLDWLCNDHFKGFEWATKYTETTKRKQKQNARGRQKKKKQKKNY